jgi:hypothetical protein
VGAISIHDERFKQIRVFKKRSRANIQQEKAANIQQEGSETAKLPAQDARAQTPGITQQ